MAFNVEVVLPLFHKYVYGDVPPDGITVMDPVDWPKQFTSVLVELELNAALGCVTVVLEVAVHPFASVTVTV